MRLHADPTRLEQVLVEPAEQRRQVHPEGGHIALEVGRRRQEAKSVVGVRDDGVGIPADMLPRIFDLFAQVERSLSRPRRGGWASV